MHPETTLKVAIQIGDSEVRGGFSTMRPAGLNYMCVRKNLTLKLLWAEIALRSCVPDTVLPDDEAKDTDSPANTQVGLDKHLAHGDWH